jgi:hypothetical protein
MSCHSGNGHLAKTKRTQYPGPLGIHVFKHWQNSKKKLFFHVDVIIVNIFASMVSQNETKMPGDLTTLSERNWERMTRMVNWIAVSQKNGFIYYFRDEQYGDEAISWCGMGMGAWCELDFFNVLLYHRIEC